MSDLAMMNVTRSSELIVSMLIGAFCCWLGFRLFEIGVSGKASLSIKKDKWQFQFLNAAPGLFFALFGAAIICLAVAQKTTFDQKTTKTNGETAESTHFEKGGDEKIAQIKTQLKQQTRTILDILSRSDESQSLPACDALLAISSEFAQINNRKAALLLKSEAQIPNALRYAEIAHAIQPGNVDYLITLADAYAAADDIPNALQAIEAASQIEPENRIIIEKLNKLSNGKAPK